MTHGASLVLQYRYDAGDALRLIEEERCTAVYTQPIIVMGLYNHPDRAKRDLRTWRTGICRPNVLHLAEEMGAREMISAYGLTECYGNSCTSDGHWAFERRRLGCGITLPGVTIEIVDLVTRELVPAGTIGEIRVGGNVTPGYYNDPQRTAEAIDACGRFLTGDLGRIEEHGVLQFCGRVKELIKTGGMNVSPAEVEEVLQEHPAVMQAVVVGIADRERDEIVAAMVALRDGSHATAEGLIAYCRPLLASYKVPRYLEIVASDAIPLTDTRKISKRIVAEQLAARYADRGGKG
jgi:fatty-acyl-CoA synthase